MPLTEAEREVMPDADTVSLTPLEEMVAPLERVGLVVRWQKTAAARTVAQRSRRFERSAPTRRRL